MREEEFAAVREIEMKYAADLELIRSEREATIQQQRQISARLSAIKAAVAVRLPASVYQRFMKERSDLVVQINITNVTLADIKARMRKLSLAVEAEKAQARCEVAGIKKPCAPVDRREKVWVVRRSDGSLHDVMTEHPTARDLSYFESARLTCREEWLGGAP